MPNTFLEGELVVRVGQDGYRRKLPVLVECIPYGARLPERSCIDRYQKAQGIVPKGNIKAGNGAVRNAIRRAVLHFCVECDVGRARMVCSKLEETG